MFPLLPLIICAIVAFISDFLAIWKIFWATWKVFWAAWKVLSNLWNIFEQPQKDFWPTRKDFWVAQKTWKSSDLFPSAHSGRRLPPSIKVGCTQINAKRCISPKSPSPKVFPFLFQFSSITYSQYFFKNTWMKKHTWIYVCFNAVSIFRVPWKVLSMYQWYIVPSWVQFYHDNHISGRVDPVFKNICWK